MTNNEVVIHVKAKDAASKALDTIGRTVVRNMTQATAAVIGWGAAFAGAAPAAVTLLKPVVLWTAKLASAFVQASPALAVFAAQGLFVKAALGQIFDKNNALVASLNPLTKAWTEMGQSASKAAADGVKPLAESFLKVASPAVASTMQAIGKEVNALVLYFLEWGKSATGLKTINAIMGSIRDAVRTIAPGVAAVGQSFLEMVGRIADVSSAAGAKGLAGVLNTLADAMDNVSAASVSKGLEDLRTRLGEIRDFIVQIVDVGGKIVDFWKKHNEQISIAADVLSGVAIAFGIIAGAPIVAVIGAVSLLVRHFKKLGPVVDVVKSAFSTAKEWLGPLIAAFQYMVEEVFPEVRSAFKKIAKAVLPVLREVAAKVRDQLIPALGELVVAVTPIIKVLVHRLGPIVALVFKGILKIVSFVLDIVIADIRRTSAIVRAAVRAYEFLRDGVHRVMNGIKNAVRAGINAVTSIIRSIKDKIVGVFSGAGSWLYDAGSRIIHGLISGIKSLGSGAISGAVRAVVPDKYEKFIPGLAHGGFVGATAAAGGPRGGTVLVGERGPEVVQLPYGSHVFPNGQGPSTGSGMSITVNAHSNADPFKIAREVAWVLRTSGR